MTDLISLGGGKTYFKLERNRLCKVIDVYDKPAVFLGVKEEGMDISLGG